jgi:hypothetical protein
MSKKRLNVRHRIAPQFPRQDLRRWGNSRGLRACPAPPMDSLSNDRLDQVRLWAAVMAEHEVLTAGLAAARGLHGSCAKGRKAVATLLQCPKQRCSPWP